MIKYLIGFLKYLFRKRVSSLTLIDCHTEIHSKSRIYPGSRILLSNIGAFTYISYNSSIINSSIGRFCSIASGVNIGLATHRLDGVSTSPVFYSPNNALKISWSYKSFFDDSHKPVIIGNDVWIGTKAVIMGGVKIGDGAVIGACAVVTKDIPPYAICVGIPAKIVRYRFNPYDIAFLECIKWWELPEHILKQYIEQFNTNDISFLKDL